MKPSEITDLTKFQEVKNGVSTGLALSGHH